MAEGGADEKASRRTPSVFVSYASHDAAVAATVVAALERNGVDCWLAPRDVVAGEFYAGAIVHAIDATRAIVLILSGNAASSQHVLRELERASSKRHPVITLRIDRTPMPAEFEYFLNSSHWLDASAAPLETELPKLVDAVQRAIAPAPVGSTAQARPSPAPAPAPQSGPTRLTPPLGRAVIGLTAVVVAGIAYLVVDRVWLSTHAADERPSRPVAAVIGDRSIAVLPFTDMSEKKDQEYFADGMAEEILNLLATIPSLRVVGRTSSFQFKGQNRDVRRIGDALGVSHLVDGSVRRSGDRVRLTAQLVDAHSGTQLWSGTFERPVGDALRMQDEIAASLARALQVSLGANQLMPRRALASVDAYNLYLRGLHAVDQLDEAGFQDAVGYFTQSLELDPAFAPAAGWLALTYDAQGEWGYVAPATAFENARRAADAAIKVDPDSFLPYAVLASVHQVYDWDWVAGEAAVQRSLELGPREPLAHFFAARYAMMLGRLDDAFAHIQTALAHDPLMPTAYIAVCWIQQRRGHLAEAEAAARRALEISPSYVSAHFFLGLVLLARGDPKAALEAMREETPAGGQLGGLAIVYHALGRKADSDAALARLIKDAAGEWAFGIAEVYAYRGELDQAFAWLDRAYQQRDSGVYTIKGDPPLQRLEGDPRYTQFLRKMQLPAPGT